MAGAGVDDGLVKGSKRFFFEKKEPKNFYNFTLGAIPGQVGKVFLLLFLQKKKILPSLRQPKPHGNGAVV